MVYSILTAYDTIESASRDTVELSYLVLVAGCTSVGRILEVELCRVTQITLIPLVAMTTTQSEQVTDIVKFLSSGAFFFSYPSNSLKFQLSSSAQYRYLNDNSSPPYFLWLVFVVMSQSDCVIIGTEH